MFGIMLVNEFSVDTISNQIAEWIKKLKRRSGQLRESQ
jgi:hypothetical protein